MPKTPIKKKPRLEKSEHPTLTGTPPLGHQNNFYCPTCGRHLFSFYDGDLLREDYHFRISEDMNYCSKCGTLLDLDEWKEKPEVIGADEEIELEEY